MFLKGLSPFRAIVRFCDCKRIVLQFNYAFWGGQMFRKMLTSLLTSPSWVGTGEKRNDNLFLCLYGEIELLK